MPRASGSGKRHPGPAGQRDARHDNGLVGPASAKRSSAKKNNGNAHHHSDASAIAAVAASAAPSIDYASAHQRSPLSPPRKGNAASVNNAATAAVIPPPFVNGSASPSAVPRQNGMYAAADQLPIGGGLVNGSSGAHALRSGSSDPGYSDETSSESGASLVMRNGYVDAGHRQIDVNALKNVDVHRDSGPLELATTVLKALPMQDTLAILIILMHVPAVSLTFIYTIFAFLTFVPPVTTSSGMNINFAEMLDGMATTPAPVTLLCMDMLFVLFWLFLWQPLQEVMLDLAKPVIAITLGGGTGSRDGTSRGLTTCFIWVMLHHLLRGTQSHWARLVRHIPDTWPIPAVLHEPFKLHAQEFEVKGIIAWTRSLLAVHILTQGIIRHVKEWYLRREKVNANVSLSDPEVGKPVSGNATSSSSSAAAAGPADGSSVGDIGLTTPETEPTVPQGPSSLSASKKKRKQSTQVRLQQPLWAALASTKIVVMKEYELSHTSREQTGSNATDVHNLGNAPFERQPRQVWISYVGSDEVCFSTSFFPEDMMDMDTETARGGEGDTMPTATKNPEKPFFVRVNNAFWQPTRMFPLEAPVEEMEEEQRGTRWTGDIYGLRPASKYVVEFVHRRTEEVLFKTSIRTVHEPQREDEAGGHAATAAATEQPSLRPDSPATTLRTSIAAADARLTEEKNQLKSARKEWKSRINNLKKEIELADNQLASAGNHDEKYRQKVRQQETQKSQAERDTAELADQLKNFDSGAELAERKKKVERAYAASKKLYDAEKKDFEDHKAKLENEVRARQVEQSNLVSRVNKMRTRINKVETELANITDANNRGLDEAERHRRERANWQDHMAAIETNYRERLMHARATNAAKLEQIRVAEAQLVALVSGGNGASSTAMLDFQQQQQQQQQPSGSWNPNPAAPPHIPSSMWGAPEAIPAVATSTPHRNHAGLASAWQPPPTAPPFEPMGARTPSGGIKMRGRSSSMLSDVSGFTQSSNEDDVGGAYQSYGPSSLNGNPWWQFSSMTGPVLQGLHQGGSSGSGSGSAPRSPV
ncbi:Chromosome segregation ATPase [Geosmithia morbida]|uniref:Chromosome segregation ATPase n=1 Tax=Geosmithia morbida TaxID=1094350 RepID=A0A9P5D4V7_9HYPO|nr:Chromosome segregation ATPase [Geosmithia morbida]KAF4121879.1 Chromosome segregation ATPase [Geosmithia morbida]